MADTWPTWLIWLTVANIAIVAVNVGVLALTLKLYTEFVKERFQRGK